MPFSPLSCRYIDLPVYLTHLTIYTLVSIELLFSHLTLEAENLKHFHCCQNSLNNKPNSYSSFLFDFENLIMISICSSSMLFSVLKNLAFYC